MPASGLAFYDFVAPKSFQAIFGAMSQPGKRIYVDNQIDIPKDLYFAAAASCLIMLGVDSLCWTDLRWNSATINWLQHQCGFTIVSEPCMATCALITRPDVMPPLSHFRIGDNEYPANAATLIIQVYDIYLNKVETTPAAYVRLIDREWPATGSKPRKTNPFYRPNSSCR